MDIKHLRYATALGEELNFARAAQKLHLSQPALSRAIQTLEEQLGFLLFDRDKRNVATTTAGDAFLQEAKGIIFQMRTLELNMAQLRDGSVGHVAFGAGPSPINSLLNETLAILRRQYPSLSLRLDSSNWRYLLSHLRAEEVEFFVADTRDISIQHDLAVMPLCRLPGGFYSREGHPLLDRAHCGSGDILHYGFAANSMPTSVHVSLKNLLGLKAEQSLPIILECDNFSLLKEQILNGNLILLAPRASLVQELNMGTLKELEICGTESLFTDIDIVHIQGRTLSPSAKIVVDALRETISNQLPEFMRARF
jgi:DNA-binding transcriptional LysR family regulator